MSVEEVENEIFKYEYQEKKRKRIKVRKAQEEPSEPIQEKIQQKSIPISDYVLNSTNTNHKIYRDFLINRKNGERVSFLNPLR